MTVTRRVGFLTWWATRKRSVASYSDTTSLEMLELQVKIWTVALCLGFTFDLPLFVILRKEIKYLYFSFF